MLKDAGKVKKVYFAGKVQQDGWRQEFFQDDRVMSNSGATVCVSGGIIKYNGPFALSCDHGCWHNAKGTHGLIYGWGGCIDGSIWGPKEEYFSDGLSKSTAVQLCLASMSESDAIVAYIDALDCFGTLAEIGFAAAIRKPTILFIKGEYFSDGYSGHSDRDHDYEGGVCPGDELWFIKNLPNIKTVIRGEPDAETISQFLFPPMTHKEKYYAYLKSDEWDSKRKAKLKDADYRCQLCNKRTVLHVHHRTYENVFNEAPGDLIVLCKGCHEKYHEKA